MPPEPTKEPRLDFKGAIILEGFGDLFDYVSNIPEKKRGEVEPKLWDRTERHFKTFMNNAIARKLRDVQTELGSETDAEVMRQRMEKYKKDINEKGDDLWEIAKARVESQVDSMTGLYVEGAFQKQYSLALNSLNKESTPEDHNMVVISFDLDFFRQVNDVFGHDGANRILEIIGERLRNLPQDDSAIRPDDSACHLHGDEFMLLLNHVPEKYINNAVERFHRIMCTIMEDLPDELKAVAQKKNFTKITASFGALVVTKGTKESSLYFQGTNSAKELSDKFSTVSKGKGRMAYTIGRYAKGGSFAKKDLRDVTCMRLGKNGKYKEVYSGVEFPKASPEDSIIEIQTAVQRFKDRLELAIREGTASRDLLTRFDKLIEEMGEINHVGVEAMKMLETLHTITVSGLRREDESVSMEIFEQTLEDRFTGEYETIDDEDDIKTR